MSILLKSRQSGFSLVEIMVGLAAGLFMLGGLLSFFVVYNRANFDLLRAIQLEQEMRATLDFINRDIRRAGYWRDAHLGFGKDEDYCALGYYTTCPVGGTPVSRFAITGDETSGQILYSYDANMDGTLEDYGFRINGGAIEYLNGSWIPLTESSRTTYLKLIIKDDDDDNVLDGGKVLDVTLPDPADPDADEILFLRIRALRITLEAEVAGDDSISRTLTETIRIRNDEYVPPP